uniref:WD_REPEATS_REGION domain-containing protein n=1 Tax=Heterorhabditis bacteriophora TaxID=37862 RepID=A0A1I7XM78_HETBA
MIHNHLLGPSSSLASTSGLQSAAALSEGTVLNHPINQTKEDLKTHFTTREGTYRVMTLAEYSRPNRAPMNQIQPGAANVAGAPVRVSFLSLNNGNTTPRREDYLTESEEYFQDDLSSADRICFNVGRELYIYLYRGTQTAADLSKPIDKRVYKAGQIQLIDPFHKEYQASRLFNEERFIDKSSVTCLKWVPGGLLTLSWSPDAKLIATGGEDDLLTVYYVSEKRVVCRGQGHKSWISQVQFDPYTCSVEPEIELNGVPIQDVGSDDECRPIVNNVNGQDSIITTPVMRSDNNILLYKSSLCFYSMY